MPRATKSGHRFTIYVTDDTFQLVQELGLLGEGNGWTELFNRALTTHVERTISAARLERAMRNVIRRELEATGLRGRPRGGGKQ